MAEDNRSSFAPFLVDEQQKIGAYEISNKVYAPQEKELPGEKPGFMETAQAVFFENFAFRKVREIQDTALSLKEMIMSPKQGFDPLDPKYLQLVSPEHYPELSQASNEGQIFRTAAEINERVRTNEVKQSGSTMGWLTGEIINGATNPFYYFALGNSVKAIKFVPAVQNVLKHTIPSFMLGVGADELDQYYNHNSRTASEALKNTMMAGIWGGIFGGVGIGARTLKAETYKKIIGSMVEGKDIKFRLNDKYELEGFTIFDDSVGAASRRELTLEGESLYGWGKDGQLHAATPLLWMTGKLARNPVVLGLTSKSATVRGFINDTLEHNLDLTMIEKDLVAPPASVQSLINNRNKAIFNFQLKAADAYYEYLGIDPSKNFLTKFAKSKLKDKKDLYSYPQFQKELYIATVEGGVHDNKVIGNYAKRFIKEDFEPIADELKSLGLLSKDIETKMAIQHVMRVYDRAYISANKRESREFFTKHYTDTNEKVRVAREPLSSSEVRIKNLEDDIKSVTNKETLAKLKEDLKNAKEARNNIDAQIKKDIADKKITEDMLFTNSKGEQELRRYLTKEEIELAANETILNILGLNEEMMNSNILSYLSTGTAGTNPLKPRVVMIPDVDMLRANILNSDMRVSFGAYATRMNRLIEMEKYLRTQGYTGDGPRLEFLTNGIKEDYAALQRNLEKREAAAIEGKSGAELEKIKNKFRKENVNLDKSQQRDIKVASTVYKRLMGETGVKYGGMLRFINASKKYLYATELGSAFLLQLQDAAVSIYRQGFDRYFNQSIIPFVRNLAALDFKNNKRFREQAMDIGAGIETLQAFYNMNFDLNADSFIPMNGFERLADKAANAMGILNFTSVWGDGFKHLAATSSYSSIYRDLVSATKGELDDKWLKRLLGLRIQPGTAEANEIIRCVSLKGEKIRGATLPNIHTWEINPALPKDEAVSLLNRARALYESAVTKEVNSVMFTGSNIASYPLEGEANGALGAFLMYMGWGFNATANFTIPMFQKMDVSRVSAGIMMLAVSSIVEPLRKLSQGTELTDDDLDGAMMFKKGLLNSGLLGVFGDTFNKMNSMGDLFPGARIDRYRNTRGIIQFGPERLVADAMAIGGMFINREWNKRDWKKAIKNVPLANLIYMRAMVNNWLDGMDIPSSREKASKLKEWK